MCNNVVSFSGGKDSTAMVLEMLNRGESIHSIVFVDMGYEFPQVYRHIDKLEKYIGIPITRLYPSTSLTDLMIHRPISRGKHKGQIGYGWMRPNARFCTTYKVQAFDKYKRNIPDLIECIGIAADEPRRIRDKRYPLVEYGITEKEALAICYKHGFHYEGLYEKFARLSCYICPFKRLSELEVIYREYPELWSDIKALDSHCINDFRPDYSIHDLEERFSTNA